MAGSEKSKARTPRPALRTLNRSEPSALRFQISVFQLFPSLPHPSALVHSFPARQTAFHDSTPRQTIRVGRVSRLPSPRSSTREKPEKPQRQTTSLAKHQRNRLPMSPNYGLTPFP
jgi:hypothetical protein